MPHKLVAVRLSVMMFLQFFIWGAWLVTTANFLKAIGWEAHTGTVYGLGPIAAMISPLFLGCIADRYFAAQKLLGVLHLGGGVLMFLLPSLATGGGDSATAYLWVLMAYVLFYMPTLGLTNAIAFHHLTDQAKQFPLIRVFGTLGWIAAGTLVSKWLHADSEVVQYQVAGAASLMLAVFSFTLPDTPPNAQKKVSAAEALGLGALGLLRQPAFLVFMLCSFLICIPLMAYYAFAPVFVGESGFADPAYVMSAGQWVEVIFMVVMPMMFAIMGVKWMLAVGMLAWALRYGLFTMADGPDPAQWMIITGILLHGICYDFFFVTGQIYVDKVAPAAIRGQAQGFLVLMTIGLGSFVGSHASAMLVEKHTPANANELQIEARELEGRIKAIQVRHTEGQATAAELTELTRISSERQEKLAAARKDWKSIWRWPAWGAFAVLIAFVILFRYRRHNGKESAAD